MLKIPIAVLTALLALSAQGRAGAKAAPTVEYFVGESRMMTPAAKPVGSSLSLVKRIVNPAENRIEEHVLSVREGAAPKTFVAVLEVKGNKFVISESGKAFEGIGVLVGEPWKWTEWKSVTTIAGGAGTVRSEDKVTEHGLTVRKTFAGPDGKVQLKFEETLLRIGAATYATLHAKLAPPQKEKEKETTTPPAKGERKKDTLRVGDAAPAFTLPLLNGKGEAKLADFRGKKPVVLIFGSYT